MGVIDAEDLPLAIATVALSLQERLGIDLIAIAAVVMPVRCVRLPNIRRRPNLFDSPLSSQQQAAAFLGIALLQMSGDRLTTGNG